MSMLPLNTHNEHETVYMELSCTIQVDTDVIVILLQPSKKLVCPRRLAFLEQVKRTKLIP